MKNNSSIYLDYAATTPLDERILDKMCGCMTKSGTFGNPASRTHSFGWQAAELVEEARGNIADLINADAKEIIFTSDATEANNLAIKGVAFANKDKGKHIITSAIEHKAVLDSCKALEKEGFEVTYLQPSSQGVVEIDSLKKAIRPDTVLISIMFVNNEVGTIQDIAKIGEIAKEHNIIFHVDAAQALGKIAIDVSKLNVNLMSLSGHKMYGPKGIGALYVRNKPHIKLVAQMHGGGHERGLRSGTLATHQIVGMGEAAKLAKKELTKDYAHLTKLRDRFWNGVKDLEAIKLNSDPVLSVPNIINISFNFIEGESLIMGMQELAVSSGSACTSASLQPSYVLKAMGLPDELAHSSIRFSFGRFTLNSEIDRAIELINKNVRHLRALSPLWDLYKQGVDLNSIKWQDDDHHH
ncbi:MAG: IscS subfamily cysteine desulfurase [Gammaproteobacteria bacterium]|nr:IscS subfamily cysteine desulfurase [Gammaproteobacteria bacterium]